jgi:acyl dehydratase
MIRPLDAEKLLAYKVPRTTDNYDPRDVILYALGVGAGLSPEVDETSLLFERQLQVLPTMALVLGTPGFWAMDPNTGLDWQNILHGEQRLRVFEPLEPSGTVVGETTVTGLADKGPGKAAMVRATKEVRTLGGQLLAESIETWVLRGAGGFGGERDLPGDVLPPVPDRLPDFEIALPTSRAQAATYRLSGDRNPLHIDPAMAQGAGFERPILHGLSTMGLVGRAIIHACCGGVARQLGEIGLRFSAPVYPGDTIRTLIWREGSALHFRADAGETPRRVIDNGFALLHD